MIRLRRLQFVPLLALAVLFGRPGGSVLFAADAATASAADEAFEGQSLTLRAEVEGGEGPFRYLWFKDYVPLLDATSAELKFDALKPTDAGTYWVTVFNDGGSTTSTPEIISVRRAQPSRVANVSVVGSAGERMLVGFTLGGNGTTGSTAVLARAAGPALTQFGILGALADPVLSVFRDGLLVSMNDDWGDDPALSTTSAAVGAFPFSTLSKDSALVSSLAASSYSVEVVDGSNGAGITVVELYDTTTKSDLTSPRLINVSARGTAGGSEAPLTAGCTIQGDQSVTVLVRGLGPTLDRLGVTGGVSNPKLSLFRGTVLLSTNEKWDEVAGAAIEGAQTAVGAVPLNADSRDAALLISLKPGSYIAQVSSTTDLGAAQIEIYEVP